MTLSAIQVVLLVLAWSAYAVLHSALASLTVKRWVAARWPHRAHGYRLGFNLLAVVLLLPPLWLGPSTGARPAVELERAVGLGGERGGAGGRQASCGSTRYYDMTEFSGGAQWRKAHRAVEDHGRLRLSPRHRDASATPAYSLGLVIRAYAGHGD